MPKEEPKEGLKDPSIIAVIKVVINVLVCVVVVCVVVPPKIVLFIRAK